MVPSFGAKPAAHMLPPTTLLKQSTAQVSCKLDAEVAILNLDKSVYFGLKGAGAEIWQALEQPRSVEELCKLIVDQFDVEPARCEADVQRFLHELQSAGLVEAVC